MTKVSHNTANYCWFFQAHSVNRWAKFHKTLYTHNLLLCPVANKDFVLHCYQQLSYMQSAKWLKDKHKGSSLLHKA